jgi:hypothetical protein
VLQLAAGLPKWDSDSNETNLLRTRPALDLFFTRNAVIDVAKNLEIHQTIDVISLGESILLSELMLHNSPEQEVCHPNVNATGFTA